MVLLTESEYLKKLKIVKENISFDGNLVVWENDYNIDNVSNKSPKMFTQY